MKLSIVTTLYYSAPHLMEFHERITRVARKYTDDYEIIMVNDGSPDDSLEIALELYRSDDHMMVVDLSRNFGHHKAIMTGLANATGDKIFLIDCDLEEQPELLDVFWKKFVDEKNVDVVFGYQGKRRGNFMGKYQGQLFYVLFNMFSPIKIPANTIIGRLMSRRYVDALLQFKEHEIFIAGLFTAVGFHQIGVSVNKGSTSRTSYSLKMKFDQVVNAITSFSGKPLYYIFYLGVIVSILSLGYILYILYQVFTHGVSIVGWPSLIISIWFVGGLIILSLGIIGIYLSKIFGEIKARPYTVIRTIYNH